MKFTSVLKLVLLVAVLVCTLFMSGCAMFNYQTLGPGEVGVKYDLYGASKGVTEQNVVRGRVHYGYGEEVYPFSVAFKRIVWNADTSGDESAQVDQSIPVSTKDGVAMALDIAVTYRVKEEKVPDLFMQYKKDSDSILTGVVRDQVRKLLATACSKVTAMELRTANQDVFLGAVCDQLNKTLGPDGFDFKSLAFTGRPRFSDSKMEDSITAVAKAKLDAQAAEELVRKTQAEADQKVAQATGEAKANAILASSLSDKNIRWQQLQNQTNAIKAWDGKLPQVTGGGGVPFIQLGQ